VKKSPLIAFGIVATIVVLLWLYKIILMPRPYWIMNAGDGEVNYFFNSLAILGGHRPPTALHPGTPLFFAGALLAGFLHSRPETIQTFLAYGYLIGLLTTLGAFAGILFVLMPQAPVWMGVAVLLSYFLHPSASLYLTQWGSYLFHLPLMFLMLGILQIALKDSQRWNPFKIALAGYAVGLSCAVHLIFFPFILAGFIGLTATALLTKETDPTPLSVGSRLGAQLLSLWGVILSVGAIVFMARLQSQGHFYTIRALRAGLFAFLTICLLATAVDLCFSGTQWRNIPGKGFSVAIVNLKYLSGVLCGWLSGTLLILDRFVSRYAIGRLYASSVREISSWQGPLKDNIPALIQRAPVWCVVAFLTWALIFLLLLRTIRQPREKRLLSPENIGLGFALVAFSVLNTLLALSQGNFRTTEEVGVSLRYLLPAVAATTCGLAWLAHYHSMLPTGNRRILKVFSLIVIVLSFHQMSRDMASHQQSVQAGYTQRKAIDAKLEDISHELGRKPLILIGNLQRPAYALRWGSATADYLFDRHLDQLYPQERELDLRNKSVAMPRNGRQADLIVMREWEVSNILNSTSGDYNWFGQIMGPAERIADGLSEPVLLIRVRHTTS